MATRRPVSRARNATAISSAPSSGLSRPRSALSKQGVPQLTSNSTREGRASPSLTTSLASTQDGMAKKQKDPVQEKVESNIQVVVRCRRRSEREVQEGSPIIVTADGRKAQSITIETAAPTSVLGVVTLPPTRTYPFDVVFGPEADQAMVYQDVVHPMLDEVIKGYNCTLFAYGQTGTGKTHTMQGDVSLTPLGNPAAQAGMIPRVLFKLFHQLENSGSDYIVKVSYVELYNEELRDLLAPELSAPAGSAQPMGMGGQKDSQGGLKIFDDSNKKGVFIQGLEEIPVKDFKDSLALLAKGSQRRQIAATRFNDHSSRSHSVFSVTVHSKEISSLGDDLLKVGKLHLVDLAGSENIGRSGAENKRAKEAGMINQSLLTLGRVINALVDKASHVPYRESKLTRLLQDSLGGRTKTCIIATISPARSNMEETLSTLDYAMRAKSIRNRPEVNQRMTRNALLKEYVAEIERLKSEVLAAREKNGIWFSEEHVARMEAEQELRQTEMEEAKKQIELIESQMRAVREEFEQSMSLLMRTDGELKETKERLRVREDELEERRLELKFVQSALEEETIVRKAHAASESNLDSIAGDLKKVVKESTSDIAGLFSKLERETRDFDSRSKAIVGQSKFLDAEARSVLTAFSDFANKSKTSVDKTLQLTNDLQRTQSEALSKYQLSLMDDMKTIEDGLKAIQSREESSERNLATITTNVKEVQDTLANKLATWSSNMQSCIKNLCSDIDETSMRSIAVVEQLVNSLGNSLEGLLGEARTQLEKEQEINTRQTELITQLASQEISRLKEQNVEMVRLIETERKNSQKSRDGLIKQISSLLVGFTEERDKKLEGLASGVRQNSTVMMESLESFHGEYESIASDAADRREKWLDRLKDTSIGSAAMRQTVSNAFLETSTSVEDGLANLRSSTISSIEKHSESIVQISQTLNSCDKVFDQERKIKKARIEATEQLGHGAAENIESTQDFLSSTSSSLKGFGNNVAKETSHMQKSIGSFINTTTKGVDKIRHHGQIILDEALRQTSPTGSTPRKRQWQYIDKWERTQDRSDLLRDFRRRNGRTSLDDVAQAVRVNLPESDLDTSDEYHDRGQCNAPVAAAECGDIKMEAEADWQPNLNPSSIGSSKDSEQPTSSCEDLPQIKADERESEKIRTARALRERSTNIDVRSRTTRRRR